MTQEEKTIARTRTVSWEDPAAAAAAAANMSGLDFLRTIARGEFPPPPIAKLLGYEIVEVEPGRAVFAMVPGQHLYNPLGMVHGGVICTLLDTAMACTVHTMLPAGVAYTTLEIKVNFIRPVHERVGRIRCEARSVHVGSRTATAEGKLLDGQDRLYAHATETCMIVRSG